MIYVHCNLLTNTILSTDELPWVLIVISVFARKGRSGADTEKYDKTEVKHGDKQCYRFIKRLQLYPQQCIR